MKVFGRINYIAAVVAGIVYFALGALWYSKLLFSDAWIAASGMTAMNAPSMPMAVSMTALFVECVITAIGVAYVVALGGEKGAINGLKTGAILAVFFAATMTLPKWVIEGKPALYFIDTGYIIAGLLAAGAIIGAWPGKSAAREKTAKNKKRK